MSYSIWRVRDSKCLIRGLTEGEVLDTLPTYPNGVYQVCRSDASASAVVLTVRKGRIVEPLISPL